MHLWIYYQYSQSPDCEATWPLIVDHDGRKEHVDAHSNEETAFKATETTQDFVFGNVVSLCRVPNES